MNNRHYILTDLKKTNEIFNRDVNRRLFSFLGYRQGIRREVSFGSYRADFYIEKTKTIVEIKSIITIEKEQAIPKIYSERTIRQLIKISELLDEGYRVIYLFVAMNPISETIQLSKEGDELAKLFKINVNKGMICKAVNIKRKGDDFFINREIQIE